MAGKNTAAFGIYKTRSQAEQGVDRLMAAGFSNNDISVLLPDTTSSKEFAHEKNTKAPEGAATGAAFCHASPPKSVCEFTIEDGSEDCVFSAGPKTSWRGALLLPAAGFWTDLRTTV